MKGRDHLEDVNVDSIIILNLLKIIEWEGLDWIYPAQDKDQCRTLLNTIMNLLIRYNAGNCFTSWVTVIFSRRTLICGLNLVRLTTSVNMIYYICLFSHSKLESVIKIECRELHIARKQCTHVELATVSCTTYLIPHFVCKTEASSLSPFPHSH
jgi:hypothetical protein